jgi:2-oxoglutarate dehydrogenase E2 component (dihydrolipoamide succinyltransferase)
MSVLEMKVPSPGESITEVEIATWLVKDGDYVEKDQPIAEVDSDKATLELPAEQSGVITLKAEEGDVVQVGQVVCLIDMDAAKPEGAAPAAEAPKQEEAPKAAEPAKQEAPKPAAPAAATQLMQQVLLLLLLRKFLTKKEWMLHRFQEQEETEESLRLMLN